MTCASFGLLVLLAVAVSAAEYGTYIQERTQKRTKPEIRKTVVGVDSCGWRPRQEYMFIIEGRTVLNIPGLSTQATGIHYRGTMRIQSHTTTYLLMQVNNITYTKLMDDLPSTWWEDGRPQEDSYVKLSLTERTFAVKMEGGTVSSISLPSGLDDWEVNFLQGLVSALQADLRESSTGNNVRSDTPMYTTMENSLLGRCEVQYEVVPIAKKVVVLRPDWVPKVDICGSRGYLEVTKTYNYSNCEYFAENHEGLSPTASCVPGSNRCGNFWNREFVTRITGCGERRDFLFLSSVSASRILSNLHLHKDSTAAVNSYLNITMVSAKPLSHRFSAPNGGTQHKDLYYRYTGSPSTVLDSKEQDESVSTEGESDERVFHPRSVTAPPRIPNHRNKKTTTPLPSRRKAHRKFEEVTTTAAPKDFSDEDSEETGPSDWRSPAEDHHNSLQKPFSPFYLSHLRKDATSCIIQKLREVVTDMAQDLENSEMLPERQTMENVLVAVKLCRSMSYTDLQKAVGVIMDVPPKGNLALSETKVFRDVIVMCGTKASFRLVKSWILKRNIKGEVATEVITAVPKHIQYPDESVVQQFYELMRSSTVQADQQLKISVILGFSNLVRVACVDIKERQYRYPVNMMSNICSPQTVRKYLPWISNQLKTDPSLRRVFIAALGNTGSSLALGPLATFANDATNSAYLRASAITSMTPIALRDPKSTFPVLLSLFNDFDNPVAVRIAAFAILIYTQPPLVTWQRIAISTWYEPTQAVGAFVYSSLKTLAESSDPVYKNVFRNAVAVLPLVKPVSLGIHRPYNLVWTSVNEELQNTVMQQLSWSNPLDGTNLYYRLTERLAGVSRVGFQGDLWVSSPSTLLEVLKELVLPDDDATVGRPTIDDLKQSTRWIRETLKITARTLPRLEGDLHWRYDPMTERMFPFDKKLPVDLARAGRKLLLQLKTLQPFHFQKIDVTSFEVSSTTEMGFPVQFEVSIPWAIRTNGEIQITKNHTELDIYFNAAYTSQLLGELSVYTAWDQTTHVAAVHGRTFARLPRVNAAVSLYKPQLTLRTHVQLLHRKLTHLVLHHSTTPFLAQHDLFSHNPASLAKTVSYLHSNEMTQKAFNVSKFSVVYKTESKINTPTPWLQNSFFVHGYPMMWPSVEKNSVAVYLDDFYPLNMSFSYAAGTVSGGNVKMTSLPQDPDHPPVTRTTQIPTTPTPSTTTLPPTTTSTAAPETTTETQTGISQTATLTPTTTFTTPTSTTTTTTTAIPTTTAAQEEISEGIRIVSQCVDIPAIAGAFNASNINPFTTEGEDPIYTYLMKHSFNGIEVGEGYVIGMNISILDHAGTGYDGYWTYAACPLNTVQRAGIFLAGKADKWKFGLTSTLAARPVPAIDLAESLKHEHSAQMNADMVYTSADGTHYQLALKTDMLRSSRKTRALSESWQGQRCLNGKNDLSAWPICREAMRESAFLDSYNFTVLYNDEAKAYGSTANQCLNYLRYRMYPYLTESVDSKVNTAASNRIRAVFSVDENLERARLWVRSPATETEILDFPVNSAFVSALRMSPDLPLMERLRPLAHCGLTLDYAATFDGVEYSYNMSSCWQVLSKDCSGRTRIAVLGRARDDSMELMVNLDNFKVFVLSAGPTVTLDDRPITVKIDQVLEVKDQVGVLIAELSLTTDNAIKLNLPSHGYQIIYRNPVVIMKVSPVTEGRLCGLCGDNNGEQLGEFRGPRDTLESSGANLAASYVLRDSECRRK